MARAEAGLGAVELVSMWVAPFARGRGVGDALVAAVVCWAADRHTANLYRRNGFVRAEGLRMVRPLRRA